MNRISIVFISDLFCLDHQEFTWFFEFFLEFWECGHGHFQGVLYSPGDGPVSPEALPHISQLGFGHGWWPATRVFIQDFYPFFSHGKDIMVREGQEIVALVLVPGYWYLRGRVTIAPEGMGVEATFVPIL